MASKSSKKERKDEREWIGKDMNGKDNEGNELMTVQLWWKEFESEVSSSSSSGGKSTESESSKSTVKGRWYETSTDYWAKVEATNDGMLGGFANISDTDLIGSLSFLLPLISGKDKCFNGKISTSNAIDLGAGIGRITGGLLCKISEKTHLVEQNPLFLETAKEKLKDQIEKGKIGNFYASSLQSFSFEGSPYDIIWMQWVLIYLTDHDLIELLKRAKKALSKDGVIVIKENRTKSDSYFVDKQDNSIIRSDSHYKTIFNSAGCKLLKEKTQEDFPKELFPVTMYLLV